MNIENKDKIIEGLKNTVKMQTKKIERYEKALVEIVETAFNIKLR